MRLEKEEKKVGVQDNYKTKLFFTIIDIDYQVARTSIKDSERINT
jgi:hypothetical protein